MRGVPSLFVHDEDSNSNSVAVAGGFVGVSLCFHVGFSLGFSLGL